MNLSTTLSTGTPNRATSTTIGGNPDSSSVHQSDGSTITGSGTPPTPNWKFPGDFTNNHLYHCNAADDKKSRRTSLQVFLPKLPSSDSLSNSPGPGTPATAPVAPTTAIKSNSKHSPSNIEWLFNKSTTFGSISFKGLTNWNDSSPKTEGGSNEKNAFDVTKLNRKESYKAQRKNYRREKKRVASELLNSLQDPAIIVLADWLKVRGTLKSWTKLWCVLKPGLLLLYKSPKTKSSHWVGTVLLTSCQIIERPSKKDGFCFKLFHPLDQSIWAPRGPDKETIGAVVQPLPHAYLIFRAPSQAAGKCWMDALELSLRCSALLLRSASGSGNHSEPALGTTEAMTTHETQWSEADYEKHFHDHAKYIPPTPPENLLNFPRPTRTKSRSPCPSPTPIFQELYIAVSHWERVLADTPDLITTDKEKIIKDLENLPKYNIQHDHQCVVGDEDDDGDGGGLEYTDDEGSNDYSPIKTSIDDLGPKHYLFSRRQRANINSNGIETKAKNLDFDSQVDCVNAVMSGVESESDSDGGECPEPEIEREFPETNYVAMQEEEFGDAGEQIEELAEEHKSLIWYLVKQVRPGMDLSKVVLPTFILEPRSFLDKLSDSYYHADYLSKAVLQDDPFNRMKIIVQWYLSGFYKKPKGLKKPYNPILGETFRCYWEHPNGSRTFYIAEQVSHHPPISAFYVTNRQDGFSISCSMLAKSKFYGNSTSAILDGIATLTLLPRGESYTLSIPYAHCKGILMGTLSMELGGKVFIECENTGYKADIEFKLKPFLGGTEYTNLVTGKIKLGKETLASLNGHWDGEMKWKDSRSGEEIILFSPTPEMRSKRLTRFVVPLEFQGSNESDRLWQHVSAAIQRDDQDGATEEKTALEEIQRAMAKERKATCSDWNPVLFQQDLVTGQWHYKWADFRAWDLRNDVKQYESNYRILTKTRHQAPMVRTASLVSSEPIILQAESRSSLSALKKNKRILGSRKISTPEPMDGSDSSHSNGPCAEKIKIFAALKEITKRLDDHTHKLHDIQLNISRLNFVPPRPYRPSIDFQTIGYVIIGLILHEILSWCLSGRKLH